MTYSETNKPRTDSFTDGREVEASLDDILRLIREQPERVMDWYARANALINQLPVNDK